MAAAVESTFLGLPVEVGKLEVIFEAPTGARENDVIDFIAVDGIGGHGADTWASQETKWLCDTRMLPFWVPRSRVLHFTYQSAWIGKERIQQRLPIIADQLLKSIIATRKAILLSKLHNEEYPHISECLAGVIFLGSPMKSSRDQSNASLIASIASSMYGSDYLTTMKTVETDSETLGDILNEFTRVANAYPIPVSCFYEKWSTETHSHDFIVDEQSATIDGFPKIILSTDHVNINRFPHPNDTNWILVRDQIVKFAGSANMNVAKRGSDRSKQRETYTDVLFVTDPVDDIETIEHNSGRLLEGSGAWLLSDPAFSEWRNSPESRVLWLHGDPGKGKTMLAISTIRSLIRDNQVASPVSGVVVACFICDNKDNRHNRVVDVLKSLIYQILESHPELCPLFTEMYEKHKDRLFTSPNALQSLWRLLKKLFAAPSLTRVYLIIDALDELRDQSVEDFMKIIEPFLDEQCRSQGVDAMPGQCEVKWLITSRNMSHLSNVLGRGLHISLEKNAFHVQRAVWRYIEFCVNELQKLKGYGSMLTSNVETALRAKSEGTFLYVSMACRALSQPSVRSLNTQSILTKLPRGLNPLYQRMVDQIRAIEDQDLVEVTKAVLRSMTLAVRPLSVQELAVAACLPEEHHKDLDMLNEYIDLCGSFVTRHDNQVRFVHESVKEYLQTVQEIFPRPIAEYQAQLTDVLVKALCKFSWNDLDDNQRLTPALRYASLFWAHHARHSAATVDWESYLSSDLFSSNTIAPVTWFRLHWEANHQTWDQPPIELTPLHMASYGGVKGLVAALLLRGHAINKKDSQGHSALIWAARQGYEDIACLLIDNGADLEINTGNNLTALIWASMAGHCAMLKLLIGAGANVHVADDMGWTALHYAAAHGNVQILQILLDAGADMNAKDISQQTPLQRATFCNNLPIIEALVTCGADTSVRDKDGLTLLHLAARDGNSELVKYWLKLTGALEDIDDQAWTPLMAAAWFGHASVVKYLIHKGANVEATSTDGNTALHLATWNGYEDVVRQLLQGDANPSKACDRGETPLQQAAWHGHFAICQLLLDAQVDPNMKTGTGLTPLHQAAANGHEVVAKLLLESGADPNAVDSTKQTPAARAEENNYHSLAKILQSLEITSDYRTAELIQQSDSANIEPLDHAICKLLSIPPESGFAQLHGKKGFSNCRKITALVNGEAINYFMKSGPVEGMFASEHAALRALHDTVPSICPLSIGHGKLSNSPDYFLLMEFIHVSDSSEAKSSMSSTLSLPQKLAKLHSTPAPIPAGHSQSMFGWPTPTYCGSTEQINSFRASWAKFYAENRLLAVLRLIDEHHGTDAELRDGVEMVARVVVPRLLGNGHLGGRRGIVPVMVHGDLWIGNRVRGNISGWDGGPQELVYDPSACYAHSEYELGIMRMFGGFSAGFFHEYHRLVPRTEPKEEYEDRIRLYQLYQYLNHYLIFRGGYKEDSMDIILELSEKYAKPLDEI
ncbi:hypothetical protein FHL15_010714 [Xylaria flabelliformis]|uniref:protein-ribulosamine 3-kinase n=1 Tax=Xylaria flabelliformis TaxID=2512241 RepID=A0A553HKC4_9PEZI|nr:hypothetical protein FHL15_010714 [Xylaria flabelliformis]